MYRDRSHLLAAVEREEDRAAAASSRRETATAQRTDEIVKALHERPLRATVVRTWASTGDLVAIAADDFCGWVIDSSIDADCLLAQALFDADFRAKLIRKYAAAKADADVTRWIGPPGFEEDAA